MMANWGTILFVVGVVPLSWLLEVRGLRTTVLLVSFLVALGTTLR
jgi:FLVCR family MFS transporter